MNPYFDETIALKYKSPTQKIRVMSESWVSNNLFCPCCGNLHINQFLNNSPVADYHCDNCGEIFELKSKAGNIGNKLNDGAYATMIERITSNSNPDLFVLQYSGITVTDFTVIPKFFFVPDIIEKRNPLSETARRAGWTGCNILYSRIPEQGKITIIKSGRFRTNSAVVTDYNKLAKLKTNDISQRGWLFDILNCVNSISRDEFTLNEVYAFIEQLRFKHPINNNIEAKIRQQLQILRDKGFLLFLESGRYKKLV